LLGCIPYQTTIDIDCTTTGPSVTGPYGATTVWDHTTYNGSSGYVSDAYVYTGQAAPASQSCGAASPPPAPVGNGSGWINIQPCLNLRAEPNGSSALVGCIPYQTTIAIDCVTDGNSVTGPYGATALWDHTSYGGQSGYVSDAYVYTGRAGAVAGGCGVTAPPPPLTGGSGWINIQPCLNLRAGPNGSSALVGCIPYQTTIAIDCVTDGNSVTGPYGATTLWDHTAYGGQAGYVSDAYVYTGQAAAVAPPCSAPPPPATGGSGWINIQPCLNLRAGPNGSTALIGCIPYQTTIAIDCTATGNSVTGPYGATTLWDHTTYGGQSGFVSDAYVYTGQAGPVAPAC
jgi:uncharacterized protein YraI